MGSIQHAQNSHFSASLREEGNGKKPLRGTPCPTFTVMVSPGTGVGEPRGLSAPAYTPPTTKAGP